MFHTHLHWMLHTFISQRWVLIVLMSMMTMAFHISTTWARTYIAVLPFEAPLLSVQQNKKQHRIFRQQLKRYVERRTKVYLINRAEVLEKAYELRVDLKRVKNTYSRTSSTANLCTALDTDASTKTCRRGAHL